MGKPGGSDSQDKQNSGAKRNARRGGRQSAAKQAGGAANIFSNYFNISMGFDNDGVIDPANGAGLNLNGANARAYLHQDYDYVMNQDGVVGNYLYQIRDQDEEEEGDDDDDEGEDDDDAGEEEEEDDGADEDAEDDEEEDQEDKHQEEDDHDDDLKDDEDDYGEEKDEDDNDNKDPNEAIDKELKEFLDESKANVKRLKNQIKIAKRRVKNRKAASKPIKDIEIECDEEDEDELMQEEENEKAKMISDMIIKHEEESSLQSANNFLRLSKEDKDSFYPADLHNDSLNSHLERIEINDLQDLIKIESLFDMPKFSEIDDSFQHDIDLAEFDEPISQSSKPQASSKVENHASNDKAQQNSASSVPNRGLLRKRRVEREAADKKDIQNEQKSQQKQPVKDVNNGFQLTNPFLSNSSHLNSYGTGLYRESSSNPLSRNPALNSQPPMAPPSSFLPSRFMEESLGRPSSYRNYKEFRDRMNKIFQDTSATSILRDRDAPVGLRNNSTGALSSSASQSFFEKEALRRREMKDQRKKRIRDRKLKVLKAYYLNDDNNLQLDNKYQSPNSTLGKLKIKLQEFNKVKAKTNKINALFDTLCPGKSKGQPAQKPIDQSLISFQDEVKLIQQKFNMTQEQAEKAILLKKEIELIDKVIQQIKDKGIPAKESEKEYILKNIESSILQLRTQNGIKLEDESNLANSSNLLAKDKNDSAISGYGSSRTWGNKQEDLGSYVSSIDYIEDIDVVLNVFVKRMDQLAAKK
eukprot:403330963